MLTDRLAALLLGGDELVMTTLAEAIPLQPIARMTTRVIPGRMLRKVGTAPTDATLETKVNVKHPIFNETPTVCEFEVDEQLLADQQLYWLWLKDIFRPIHQEGLASQRLTDYLDQKSMAKAKYKAHLSSTYNIALGSTHGTKTFDLTKHLDLFIKQKALGYTTKPEGRYSPYHEIEKGGARKFYWQETGELYGGDYGPGQSHYPDFMGYICYNPDLSPIRRSRPFNLLRMLPPPPSHEGFYVCSSYGGVMTGNNCLECDGICFPHTLGYNCCESTGLYVVRT